MGAMPIDYSKFDSIGDSDEETAPTSGKAAAPVRKGPAADGGARQGGSLPSSAPPAGARPSGGRGGAEKLEPAGLDTRLRILGSSSGDAELDRLASQLEKWGGAGGGGHFDGGRAAAPPPPPEPSRPNEPKRICMKADGRKKIHTTFPDGAEMVEEFDEKTDVLLLRKVRKPSTLGKETEWVFEVGQAPEASFDPHSDLMRASSGNPIFLRKDTPEHFQWRIRNLPYAPDVYSVTVDHEKQEIVVRTSNKKYFKRIGVPDVARLGLKLQDNALSWKHQHNTLIISCVRPAEVVAQEQKALREAEKAVVPF